MAHIHASEGPRIECGNVNNEAVKSKQTDNEDGDGS